MSENNIIATNISLLQNPEYYEEFQAGSFKYLPNMVGYTLKFKKFKKYEVYLVLNTAEGFKYDDPLVEKDNFVIMVINISSLDYFLNNLNNYINPIIDVLKEVADKDDVSDRELPYGYERNEDGEIKVNPSEAIIVKKIFKEYPAYKSIRKIAYMINADYSFVHDILHDSRYARMPIRIVPEVDIKRAFQVIQSNRKNQHSRKKVKRIY